MASSTQESITNHTKEYHEGSLQKLCRLCASRLKTDNQRKNKTSSRKAYSVENKDYAAKIKEVFDIDVTKDKYFGEHQYPKNFCNACRVYMYVTRTRATPSERIDKRMEVDRINWKWNAFQDSMEQCFACCTFNEQSSPGRRKKKSKPPVNTALCQKCQADPPEALKEIQNFLGLEATEQNPDNQRHVNSSISFSQAPPAPKENQEFKTPENDNISVLNSTSIQDYLDTTKGQPISELDQKLLSCIIAKYGKQETIQVPTGGQVSKTTYIC